MSSFPSFQIFLDRYIIARTPSFRPGHELEDGWKAVRDATALFKMMREARYPYEAEEKTQLMEHAQFQRDLANQQRALMAAQMNPTSGALPFQLPGAPGVPNADANANKSLMRFVDKMMGKG